MHCSITRNGSACGSVAVQHAAMRVWHRCLLSRALIEKTHDSAAGMSCYAVLRGCHGSVMGQRCTRHISCVSFCIRLALHEGRSFQGASTADPKKTLFGARMGFLLISRIDPTQLSACRVHRWRIVTFKMVLSCVYYGPVADCVNVSGCAVWRLALLPMQQDKRRQR